MSGEARAVKGLPAPLPEGERILWQGAPETRPFLKQLFYTRAVVAYIGVLVGWGLVAGAQAGNFGGAAVECAKFAGLACGALALLGGLAWMLSRSTTYTITTQRILIEYGAAMEKTVQIPFASIAAADVALQADGTGDLVLSLIESQKVNFFLLWPHVRPWHISRAEPSLRAVGHAGNVAQILSRALAASAGTSPLPVLDTARAERPASVAAAA